MPNGLLELECIDNTLSDIVDEYRLSLSSAVICYDIEVVPVVSLFYPMSDKVILHTIYRCRSKDRRMRERIQHCFLAIEFSLLVGK